MRDASRPTSDGLIWATRGRTWGFRFVRRDGWTDPLEIYDQVFAHVPDLPEAFVRVDDRVGLRFPDPEGRRDASGRLIPHEFVLTGNYALGVDSVQAGIDEVWPLVCDEFAQIWSLSDPGGGD